jgi:hypothetical protein
MNEDRLQNLEGRHQTVAIINRLLVEVTFGAPKPVDRLAFFAQVKKEVTAFAERIRGQGLPGIAAGIMHELEMFQSNGSDIRPELTVIEGGKSED